VKNPRLKKSVIEGERGAFGWVGAKKRGELLLLTSWRVAEGRGATKTTVGLWLGGKVSRKKAGKASNELEGHKTQKKSDGAKTQGGQVGVIIRRRKRWQKNRSGRNELGWGQKKTLKVTCSIQVWCFLVLEGKKKTCPMS